MKIRKLTSGFFIFIYMKQLNLYISEKLKINKDSKVETNKELIDKILYITSLKDDKNIRNLVEAWVNGDKVKTIKVYMMFTLNSHKYLNKLNRHVRGEIYHQQLDKFDKTLFNYFPSDPSHWLGLCDYKSDDITIYSPHSQGKSALYFDSNVKENSSYDILIVRDTTIDDL